MKTLNQNDMLDIAVMLDCENHKQYLKALKVIEYYLSILYHDNLQLYKQYKAEVISDIIDILNDEPTHNIIMSIYNNHKVIIK